ncbi:O-antigen ligase family protein [Sphingomonas sp. FW199]|uniref:O-antigen ligase family protein n=1 Tax=Sphingomonas sp. FW199 TaxID=3400217 RepID=UPI003CF11918
MLLVAAIALPLIQLIPLPPAWWQALPGRDILLIPGEPVPWRPWTMTPAATRNALGSLIVPVTMFVVLTQANERVLRWLPTILMAMILAAVLLGLVQFSGAGFNSPFLNDTPGAVSSIFANRNHFALFLAVGCLAAPVWAFADRDALRWRGPLCAGFVLLVVLTILATGSRSGMLLGALSLALALALVGQQLRRRLRGAPRWVLPALVGASVLVIAGVVALSFAADRADAITRLIALESSEDMRTRARPTVLAMIAHYMPFGSGFGGFDPVFRIHEPFELLKFTYFNQAHNDFLGVALDGGLAGVALLVAGFLWWLFATVRAWRAPASEAVALGRLGSAIIFLVLVASLTDYPARTPTIMAVVVIAGVWLSRARPTAAHVALPA